MRLRWDAAADGAMLLDVFEVDTVIGEGKIVMPTPIEEARVSFWLIGHEFSAPTAGAIGKALLLLAEEADRLNTGVSLVAWERLRSGALEAVVSNEHEQPVAALALQGPEGDQGAQLLWTPNPAVRLLSGPVVGAMAETLTVFQVRIWLADAKHFGARKV